MTHSFIRSENLKAVFVDLDDTLSDETAHMRGAIGRSLHDQRHRLPHGKADAAAREHESIVRDLTSRYAWDEMTREQRWELALQRADVEDGNLAAKISEGYFRHYYEGVSFLPGAERLLDSASRLKSCLITNGASEHQWGKIKLLDIDSRVDYILVSEDVGIQKPDRRIFERALDLTGAEPAESVMIGDSIQADIAGAAAVGIGTIWVNVHGLSMDEATHEPDEIVSNPGEATLLIEKRIEA